MFEKELHGIRGTAALAVLVGHVAGGLAEHIYSNPTAIEVGAGISRVGSFAVE